MKYKVVRIIDGDTFVVSPRWKLWFKTGDRIRPTGYNTPEKGERGFEEAALKLQKLILGKYVVLKKPIKLTYGRLLCEVYFKGRNLADYFPEYN